MTSFVKSAHYSNNGIKTVSMFCAHFGECHVGIHMEQQQSCNQKCKRYVQLQLSVKMVLLVTEFTYLEGRNAVLVLAVADSQANRI